MARVGPAFFWPNGICLSCRCGTNTSMSVRLRTSVSAVARRVWNKSAIDCCGRILTGSTPLSEMSMPTQRRCSSSWISRTGRHQDFPDQKVREYEQLQSFFWLIDPIMRVCLRVSNPSHRASKNFHITKLFISF